MDNLLAFFAKLGRITSPDDLALLDQVADLTSGDVPEFDRLRRLYESDDRLRVPGTIHSYTEGDVRSIDLE